MPDQEEATFFFPEALGPGHFVQVPSWFLRHPDISQTAKLLYMTLLSYAGEGIRAFPGQATLVKHVCTTLPTLRKAAKELIDYNLLVIEKRGQGFTNIYTLKKLPLCKKGTEVRKEDFFIQDRTIFSVKDESINPTRMKKSTHEFRLRGNRLR